MRRGWVHSGSGSSCRTFKCRRTTRPDGDEESRRRTGWRRTYWVLNEGWTQTGDRSVPTPLLLNSRASPASWAGSGPRTPEGSTRGWNDGPKEEKGQTVENVEN